MGVYTKVGPWVTGAPPAISAANRDTIETQHELAVEDIDIALKPPIAIWTAPGWYWGSVGTRVVTANRTYYMLIYVSEDTTYDRIGIHVTTGDGAGGTCDLRIFEEDGGVPGDLVLSAGTVNTNAAGSKEIDIDPTALTRDYYFLAARFNNTPTCRVPLFSGAIILPASGLSITPAGDMNNTGIIMYDDAVYADPAGAVDGILQVEFAFLTLREA